jgi:hypothetical protein
MSIIYSINKGINKPIEFKGIKAQYIMYLAIGLVVILIVFTICYMCGVSSYISLPMVAILGFSLLNWVMRFSAKYGQFGLLKETAYRSIPATIRCFNRSLFIHLSQTPGS